LSEVHPRALNRTATGIGSLIMGMVATIEAPVAALEPDGAYSRLEVFTFDFRETTNCWGGLAELSD
jgi:hypothetical protein